MPAAANFLRTSLKCSSGTDNRHLRVSSCCLRLASRIASRISGVISAPACGGRAPDGGPTRGSTWPENNSHSPMPIPAIALMASSSERLRKLYDCMPIRTPLTLLLILAEPCASATVIGSPTMASLPNSLLEYIIAFLILFFIWNFTSPKAHDLLPTALASHLLLGVAAGRIRNRGLPGGSECSPAFHSNLSARSVV